MGDDLYTAWLDISPGPRPPDHYALLGIERFCRDQDVIETAARARLSQLDEYAMHPDRAKRNAVQDMMNEVARARVDLIDPDRQQAYDRELAGILGVEAPALASTPSVEEEALAAPAAPAAAGAPEAAVTDAQRFEAKVWTHLKRWKLNAQEERLLIAEAASMGIDAAEAQEIIHRIDQEAEVRAETHSRRTTAVLLGIAAVVLVVLGTTVFLWRWSQAKRNETFVNAIAAARTCLSADDLRGAAAKSAEAQGIYSSDNRLEELRREIDAKRKQLRDAFDVLLSQAETSLADGKLEEVGNILAKAERLFPEDPKLAESKGELAAREADRARAYQTLLEDIGKRLDRGDLKGAADKLTQAKAQRPDDPHLARLDKRMADVRGESEDEILRVLSKAYFSVVQDKPDEAARWLDQAEQIVPGHPKCALLRQRLEKMRRGEKKEDDWERSLPVLLAAARECMGRGDYAAAEKALASVPNGFRSNPGFAEVQGELHKRKTLERCLDIARDSLENGDLGTCRKRIAEAERLGADEEKLRVLRHVLLVKQEADLESWRQTRGKLSPDEQVATTLAKLKEVNGSSEIVAKHSASIRGIYSLSLAKSKGLVSLAPLAGLQMSHLDLSGCTNLKSLVGVQNMQLLSLRLAGCDSLTDLGPLAGMKLTSLTLGCALLEDLSVLRGVSTEGLVLYGCKSLNRLDGIEGLPLKKLKIEGCSALSSLAPIKGMQLEDVTIYDCRLVTDFDALVDTALTELHLTFCDGLTTLTPLRKLKLEKLDVGYCKNLKTLDGIEGMPLKEMQARSCEALTSVAALRGARVTSLDLSSCKALKDLRGLESLSLEKLNLSYCKALTALTGLRAPKLTSLDLSDCESLTSLAGIEGMRLTEIEVDGCKALTSLQPLRGMKVTRLYLYNCHSLTDLRGVEGMPLKDVDLDECHSLTSIQPLRGMQLDTLELEDCKSLKALGGLQGTKIESLRIRNCELLVDLTGLSGCTVESINLSDCKALTSLTGLAGTKADSLSISSCHALRDLKGLEGAQLRSLTVSSCKSLMDLRGLERTGTESVTIRRCESLTPAAYEALKRIPTLERVSTGDVSRDQEIVKITGAAGRVDEKKRKEEEKKRQLEEMRRRAGLRR